MTELLERAITAIKELPDDNQNAIAARLLAEIADEQKWLTRFSDTTDSQWDNLANKVRQSIATEKTMPLEAVFPQGENS
jgi:hypothetical protein